MNTSDNQANDSTATDSPGGGVHVGQLLSLIFGTATCEERKERAPNGLFSALELNHLGGGGNIPYYIIQ